MPGLAGAVGLPWQPYILHLYVDVSARQSDDFRPYSYFYRLADGAFESTTRPQGQRIWAMDYCPDYQMGGWNAPKLTFDGIEAQDLGRCN